MRPATFITVVAGLVLALSLPAAAAAQAPAPGAMSLRLGGTHHVGHDDVVLRGDRVRVRGTVAPYVAGQSVVVRAYRGRKRVAAKTLAVRQVAGSPNGGFVVSLRLPRGRLTVGAVHRATTAQAAVVAKRRRLSVVRSHAEFGTRGPVVQLLQRRLAVLHYAVARSGVFDASTARAVIAYRKVTGRARIATAPRSLLRALLAGRGAFHARHPGHGKHVEVDLSRQVLALLRGRRVDRIYGVSSGKPSTPTVLGSFRVYSQTPGFNAKGMLDSNYFHGGYAIHGYPDVPPYAASHGCLRIPIPQARFVMHWLRFGDRVDVYR